MRACHVREGSAIWVHSTQFVDKGGQYRPEAACLASSVGGANPVGEVAGPRPGGQ